MTDYAAAPIQPIANLLLTPSLASLFTSRRGVMGVARTPGGAVAGDFTITLDLGLPGDLDLFTGAGYTMINQRGSLGGLDGGTTITQVAVTYPTIFTVRVVFSIASVGTDPHDSEIIIWRANPANLATQGGGGGPPGPPPPPPAPPVPLGLAGQFTVLAKTAITNIGPSSVVGTGAAANTMGVSPAAAASITGFGLVLDGGGQFSTSAQVIGHVLAADYAAPTPALLTQAVLDMQAAYTDASSRTPTVTNLNAGEIGGRTLPAGIYKFTTNLLISTNLILTGSASDVFIFITTGNLTQASAVTVTLAGGALPQNVIWAVAGIAQLGTTAVGRGIYLSQTQIIMQTGATVVGQLLAQTQVTFDHNTTTHE
jgi:Ice-binding-like